LTPQGKSTRALVRVILQGEKEMAWNVKLVYGQGELVIE
jgi:hypothetical protein